MNSKVKVEKDEEHSSDVIRKLIKSVVSKMGPKYTAEEKKEHAKLLLKIFEKGLEPYEAMKLSEQDMAQIYLFSYRLFNTGKFVEACEVFKMLTTLAPMEPGFVISLGVCYHKLKEYEKAIRSYLMGAFIDTEDPTALFYAYDCYMNLNDKICAGIMLSNALARCGDNPKYARLKERTSGLLEVLEKEIAEQQQKK